MADIFGDRGLFLEFEKDRPPADEILMQKLDGDLLSRVGYKISDANRPGDVDTEGLNCANDNGHKLPSPEFENGTNRTKLSTENSDTVDYIRKLENDNYHLTALNAQLQNQNRLINVERYSKNGSSSGPLLQILFMNHTAARRYRTEIESFVASLIERDGKAAATSFGRMPALSKRPNYIHVGSSDSEPLNGELCNSATVIGACQYYNLFVVDPVGWPLVEYNPSLSEGWQIPTYEQVFMDPLPCEEEDEKASAVVKVDRRPKRTCFNCGGEHTLINCKVKQDHKRIAESRRQFTQNFSPSVNPQQKQTRYHADEDPRFAGMRAGVISDSLRSALGLSASQLPPYIYQMRRLGYPPGHLESARHQTSGLSMFGKHGLEVDEHGEMMEDGEVKEESSPNVIYDMNKFIEYPGFNVDADPGMIDDWQRLGMPPRQPHHDKEAMLQQLRFTPIAGTKRQSSGGLDDSGIRQKIPKYGAADDMDLDESVSQADPSSLIVTATEVLPLPPAEEDDYYVHVDGDDSEPLASPVATRTLSAAAMATPTAATPVSYGGSSISFTLGTPTIDTSSISDDDPSVPVIPKSLPDRSQFSVGVSDHILFENLPNATGTYKRLREVMRSIGRRSGGAGTPPQPARH